MLPLFFEVVLQLVCPARGGQQRSGAGPGGQLVHLVNIVVRRIVRHCIVTNQIDVFQEFARLVICARLYLLLHILTDV